MPFYMGAVNWLYMQTHWCNSNRCWVGVEWVGGFFVVKKFWSAEYEALWLIELQCWEQGTGILVLSSVADASPLPSKIVVQRKYKDKSELHTCSYLVKLVEEGELL